MQPGRRGAAQQIAAAIGGDAQKRFPIELGIAEADQIRGTSAALEAQRGCNPARIGASLPIRTDHAG